MNKDTKLYQQGGLYDEDLSQESVPSLFQDLTPDELAALPEFESDLSEEKATLAAQTEYLAQTPADYGQVELPEDYGKYKQDYDITSIDQFDEGLSEFRGKTQSIGDKWGNGFIKFGGKTATNIIGSTIGLGYGIYAGVRDGEWNSFYNNEFGRGLDDVNKFMDETLPNHYTQLEREKGLWDQMGTANFWSDQVLNGASFVAGAVLTEMLTAGLGSAGLGASFARMQQATRLLKNSARANRVEGVIGRGAEFMNRSNILQGSRLIRQLATGAAYESSVEARHSYDTVKSNYTDVLLVDKGYDPSSMSDEEKFKALTPDERQDIENKTAYITNGLFVGNFALVGMSNMLMIPSLYGKGLGNIMKGLPGGESIAKGVGTLQKSGKKLTQKYLGETALGRASQTAAGKKATDIALGVGKWSRGVASEAILEEGGQGIMQRAAADYSLLSGIREDDSLSDVFSSAIDSFTQGTEQTFGTTEGQKEMLIGGLLGGMGVPFVNFAPAQAARDVKERRQYIDKLEELQKKYPSMMNSLRAHTDFFNNTSKRSDLLDSALEGGDMSLAKNLEYDNFFDYVMAKITTGQYEDIEDAAKDIQEMSNEEFREQGGYTAETLPDNEVTSRKAHVIEATKERANKIKEAIDKVDRHLRLSDADKVLGVSDPKSLGFLRRQLIHNLSVIDNVQEREKDLIGKVAKLTGGTISPQSRGVKYKGKFRGEEDRTDAIEYTDAEGNVTTTDIGGFYEDVSYRAQIERLNDEIQELEKVDPTDEVKERLEELYERKTALSETANELENDIVLSPEEYEQIIQPWVKSDPEGATLNQGEVLQYLTDLRKLRARRQKSVEMYKQLMDPTYRPQAIQRLAEDIQALRDLQKTTDPSPEVDPESLRDQEFKNKLSQLQVQVNLAPAANPANLKNAEIGLIESYEASINKAKEVAANAALYKGRYKTQNVFTSVGDIANLSLSNSAAMNNASEWMNNANQDVENIGETLKTIEEIKSEFSDKNLEALNKIEALQKGKLTFIQVSVEDLKNKLNVVNSFDTVLQESITDFIASSIKSWNTEDPRWNTEEITFSPNIITEFSKFTGVEPSDVLEDFYTSTVEEYNEIYESTSDVILDPDAEIIGDPVMSFGKDNYSVSPEEAGKNADKKASQVSGIRPDIKDVGFWHTSGRQTDFKGRKGAESTYNDLKDVKNRDPEQEKEFKQAESQLDFFHFVHTTSTAGNKYALAVVSKKSLEGLPNDIKAQIEDRFYQEKDSEEEDIKLVVIDKDTNTFVVNEHGRLIYTSAMEPYIEKYGESRFTNKSPGLNASQRLQKEADFKTWRDSVTDSEEISVYNVTGKSNGSIFPRLAENYFQNIGRVAEVESDYKNTKLGIATSQKVKEGRATLTIGKQKVRVAPGRVTAYDAVREVAIPMIGRALSPKEVTNVSRIVHLLLQAREQFLSDGISTDPLTGAWDALRGFTVSVQGKDVNVFNTLNDIVYTEKDGEFRLNFNIRTGKYTYGKDSISIGVADFQNPEAVKDFEDFLATKYHNTNNATIDAAVQEVEAYRDGERVKSFMYEAVPGQEWGEIILNPDLTLSNESKLWSNYNEYLLTDRKEGLSPLVTKIQPISADKNIEAFRFEGGYLQFNPKSKALLTAELVIPEVTNVIPAPVPTVEDIENVSNEPSTQLGLDFSTTAPTTQQSSEAEEHKDKGNVTIKTKVSKAPNGTTYNNLDVTPDASIENSNEDVLNVVLDIVNEVSKTPHKSRISGGITRIWESSKVWEPLVYLNDYLQGRYGRTVDDFLNILKADSSTKKAIKDSLENRTPLQLKPTQQSSDIPGKLDKKDFLMFTSLELPSTKYVKETYKKEIKRAKGMTSASIIEVTKFMSLMNPEYVSKLTKDGEILVRELDPGGTAYHEAFHSVSMRMLSQKDSDKLYENVRAIEGESIPYKEIEKYEVDPSYAPKSKPFSEFTNVEAEEWLAEEFRRYVMSKGEYVIGEDTITKDTRSLLKKLFDMIRDTMQAMFSLDKSFAKDSNITGIEELFLSITEGDFKFAEVNMERDLTAEANMIASMVYNGQSDAHIEDMLSTITAYFIDALSTDENFTFDDFLKTAFSTDVSSLSNVVRDAYFEAFSTMQAAYIAGIEESPEGSEDQIKYKRMSEYLFDPTEAGKQIRRKLLATHASYMQQLGLSFELEDDRDENDVLERSWSDNEKSFQISPIDSSSRLIKLLLGTITDNTKVNSTGLKGVYPLTKTHNILQNELVGTLKYEDQLAKLRTLSQKYPWAQETLNRLESNTDVNTFSIEDIILRTAFEGQFGKNNYNVTETILSESGRIRMVDPALSNRLQGISSKWTTNLRFKAASQPYVTVNSEGKIVVNSAVKASFRGFQKSISEIKSGMSDNIQYSLDALEHLGVVFSDRDEIISKEDVIIKGKNKSYGEAVNQAAAFMYKELVEKQESPASLFNSDETDTIARMNLLREVELTTSEKDYNLQFLLPDGKLSFSTIDNNFISAVANYPYEDISEYYENNAFTKNSLVKEARKKGKKIEIGIIPGLRTEAAGSKGVKTSNLNPTDLLTTYVNQVMNGIMPMTRAADQSSEFSIKFPIDISKYTTVESGFEALKGYMEDEILSSNAGIFEKKYIKNFDKKIQNLRLQKKFMDRAPNEVKLKVAELINTETLQEGEVRAFLDTEEVSNAIYGAIKDVIKDTNQELKTLMQEKGIIAVTPEHVSLIGINREYFRAPGQKDLPAQVTSAQFDAFLEELTMRQVIYTNEIFKTFLGDPAFYSDLFKRIKGATGIKTIFSVTEIINDYLNLGKNSRTSFDGKIANGFEDMVVVQEPTRVTPLLEEYSKYSLEYAKETEKSDGTILTTLPAYREMAIRGRAWSPDQDLVYEQIMSGQMVISDLPYGTFPPLKLQYFGFLPQDKNSKTQVPGFFKMSVAPIYPQLGKMGDSTFPGITNMYNFMKESQLGGIILPSAFKVGTPLTQLPLMEDFDGQQKVRETEDLVRDFKQMPGSKVTIDYRFMGLQLEVPSKFKDEIAALTQAQALADLDIYQGGELIKAYKHLGPISKRFNEVRNGLNREAFKNLLKELNLERDGNGQFRVIDQDYSKLLETVKVESVRRDIPKALISAIEYLEKLNSEDKSVYFDLVSNKSRLQSVLYSIANKRVIRQKFKGDNYVQQSSLGFEVRQDPEAFGLKELESYKEGESAFMEVYLPHYFKEFADRELTISTIPVYNKSKRKVIGTKEVIKDLNTGEVLGDSSLLEAIGIRIPTDGIHSIEAIKIKGFLPRAAGPTIIVPSELVTKSGSDFDIDKLSVYLPSYSVRGNRLVKERFYENTKEWYEAEQARLKRNMDTLEDLEDVLDATVERRDVVVDMLTDSFVSKIFGEDLADDIFEEYKIPLNEEKFDKLAQYLKSNSEDAEKFYEKIKNRVETSQVLEKSFKEWEADNPKASVYNLNRRDAMQNQYMDDMRTLVTDPSRRMEYMQPVGVEKIAATKAVIQELYERQGNDSLVDLSEVDDYYDATTIANLIRVYEAFFKGKKVVGISALATTHHSKAQKAGLLFDMLNKRFKLPYRIDQTIFNQAGREKSMPFRINFEGFQDISTASLSRVQDNDGGRISDNLSQITNASVDIVKNPDLHFLNLDPNNANMWMFLIRLGVPIQTIAMFANQPIVKDYMEALEVDKSKTSEVMKQSKEFRSEVIKGIREKYMAPDQYNMVYSADLLVSTVAVDVEAMSPADKSLQLQILDDMLFYNKMGDNLGNIVTAQSFDTKTFNNQNEVRVALKMYQNALDTEAFINVEKITEGQDITAPQPTTEARKYTPENITSLEPNQVFVFGANTAGGHGGGTAGLAQRGNTKSNYTALPQGTKGKWAEYGVVDQLMEGTEGKSFGIVTKAASVSGTKLKIGSRRSVPLERIEQSINSLIETANNNPELEFLVTKFGTNMAGFTVAEMKSLLEGKSLPDNIILPKEFETRPAQPTTEVKSIPMQPDNISKILSGEKTTTLRTNNFPSGVYRIGGQEFNLTNRGLLSIGEAGGVEAITESEDFEESGPKFSTTKDFLDGTRKLYVIDIVPTESTAEVTEGVSELFESNPKLANTVYEALGFKQSNIEDYKDTVDRQTFKYLDRIQYLEDWKTQEQSINVKNLNTYIKKIKLGTQEGKYEVNVYENGKEVNKYFNTQEKAINEALEYSNYYTREYSDILFKNTKDRNEYLDKEIKKVIDKAEENEDFRRYYAEILGSEITPQQKQQAQQQYSEYLNTVIPSSKQDIQGFKDFIAKDFVPSTFMESMTEFNIDLENLFNSLYLVNNAGETYQKGFNRILNTFTNPDVFMDNQDRARVLNRYENGYISFLLQNLKGEDGVSLGEQIGKIKFGDKSIAKTIAYIQNPANKHPFRTNGFITSLTPIIASKKDGVALSDDYLEPINRSMSTPEMNVLHDEFKKLKGIPGLGKQLADRLIQAAYLQSGLNSSKTSFLDTIPGDDIMELFKEVLDQFEDGYGGLEHASRLYYSKFFTQAPNSDDYTIVPKGKKSTIKAGIFDFTFKFTEASVVARNKAIEEGNIPPRLEKTLYMNQGEKYGIVAINKLGSPTLEDYYQGSGPRTINNVVTEESSKSDENVAPSDSVLPDKTC